jgi:endo-beta-N-acetylglucosaminidase D
MRVPKNHFKAEVKNTPALTVKTAQEHLAFQAKAKRHKLVQIVFVVIARKKAVMRVNQTSQSTQKVQALEIAAPTLPADLGAVSSSNHNNS